MGVCTRKKLDENDNEGEREGVRLNYFDYTGKEVYSIKKFDKKIKEVIKEFKSKLTSGHTTGWIESERIDGTFYEMDDITILKGVGEKYGKKLSDQGINHIYQLALCNSSHDQARLAESSKIPLKTIVELSERAREAEHGDPPKEVNHLLAKNPFESRYGDIWMEEIKKVKAMGKCVCITDLVHHMNNVAKEAFKNTKYAETYLFYHDALATMTDKDCIQWMRDNELLKRWILPELGLNDVIEVIDENGVVCRSKRYGGRPVGDCTEVMPLDNSLFRDLRTSNDIHVALSYWLPLNDKRRFSKSTPLAIRHSIARLWDPISGVSPKPV